MLGGWLLSQYTVRQGWRWQERQSVRQRQDEVASKFDAEVVRIMRVTPTYLMNAREASEPLRKARARYSDALTMTTILTGEELDDRVYALDIALFVAAQEAKTTREEMVNFWPLEVAFRDVRKALAAFQKRERLPPAEFPTAKELLRLGQGATTMEQAHEELMRRGVM